MTSSNLAAPFKPRWNLQGNSIHWDVRDRHTDRLEMSGRQISAVVDYGQKSDVLALKRTLVWPMLRTRPDNTRASLTRRFGKEVNPRIFVDGKLCREQLTKVVFDGQLTLHTQLTDTVELVRVITPSTDQPVYLEQLRLRNKGQQSCHIQIKGLHKEKKTFALLGVSGSYRITASIAEADRQLEAGETLCSALLIQARVVAEQPAEFHVQDEIEKRRQKVSQWQGALVLDTPEPELNAMFGLAKVRATESIFATQGGPMHGPGGLSYYAAIWANDQAEYVNPLFPFIGDGYAIESAMNSFRHFFRFTNDDFKSLPSSIIAEGRNTWQGAGDRGDSAMIAYGASYFALAQGDRDIAEELWPLITWCLEYNRRQKTADGVIASDSDELEERHPSGKVNLCTNMLGYGGLTGASHLAAQLGKHQQAEELAAEAKALKLDIDRYFAADMGGFDTYKYYQGNKTLRAWIALPLCFGFEQYKTGTVDALLSPRLWSPEGVLTEEGKKSFWDRATLYAFRGLFAVGELERAMPYFRYYSHKRLLGDHVPYAVEAWPEGDQRHLSAESGLYVRAVTEGLFGIKPVGFRSFNLTPRLPQEWDNMALRAVKAFGHCFDIETSRKNDAQEIRIYLDGELYQQLDWNGGQPVSIRLPD